MYIIFIILKERKCHFVHSLHWNFFLLFLFFLKGNILLRKLNMDLCVAFIESSRRKCHLYKYFGEYYFAKHKGRLV